MRIGVDLGGTKIAAAALADDGTELGRRRVPTPAGYEPIVRAVGALVHALEAELGDGVRAGPRASVGVGTPGALSPASGLMKNANSTCLIGQRLDHDLAQVLGREVRIANDANCFALSEATDGSGVGARAVFGVILGTGVGGGIVVDGAILSGANAIAGEWGHNPLPGFGFAPRLGPRCYCGRHGCIETFLSGPALARDFSHHEPAPPGLDAATVLARAEAGDAPAGACLERYYERLALALAGVINLLDPDVIVLGGGLSNIAPLYREVPRRWGRHVFSDRVSTRLLPPLHGDASGVRGAARLWPAAAGA